MTTNVRTSTNLLVIADHEGTILSAIWPGIRSGDAPTVISVDVPDDQTAHEIEVPPALYDADPPDLSAFRVQVSDGVPSLVKNE